MGEPGGISAEISGKAWSRLRKSGPTFFLIDDIKRLERLQIPVEEIDRPDQAAQIFPTKLPVLHIGQNIDATLGVADTKFGKAVIHSIEKAVELVKSGDAAALTTNPINKASLYDAGFKFPGHTEFLEKLTQDTPMPASVYRGCVMMIAGPKLKTVPVTIHHSLQHAIERLTTDRIIETAKVVESALRADFGISNPRLALSGLNPHAGEAGALGHEEKDIIEPAIGALKNLGIDATGPHPADTMFHDQARTTYDAAICMYHDQALIPAKVLNFHEAVNVTLGLPIIRTSPDHGTALNIAGRGIAREDSLVAAITLAADMATMRAKAP